MSMNHINALFAPRPAMPFMPSYKKQLGQKKMPAYTGVAAFLKEFESTVEDEKNFESFKPIEQRKERRERIAMERDAMTKETMELKTANWAPQDYTFETDAYKTLFVGRLSFLTDELKLKREFEQVRHRQPLPYVRPNLPTKRIQPRPRLPACLPPPPPFEASGAGHKFATPPAPNAPGSRSRHETAPFAHALESVESGDCTTSPPHFPPFDIPACKAPQQGKGSLCFQ